VIFSVSWCWVPRAIRFAVAVCCCLFVVKGWGAAGIVGELDWQIVSVLSVILQNVVFQHTGFHIVSKFRAGLVCIQFFF
jgi:hypothetical protein